MRETAAGAAAYGVQVGNYPSFPPIRTFVDRDDDATIDLLQRAVPEADGEPIYASMAQDLLSGQPLEVDAVFGNIVERAELQHVPSHLYAWAVVKCGGLGVQIGLGRTDATEPAPERLPMGTEGAVLLKAIFASMGLGGARARGALRCHTLGHASRRPFTPDPWVLPNSYFGQLLAQDDGARAIVVRSGITPRS